MNPRIKICCINSIDEAKTAIEFGASAVGLVAKIIMSQFYNYDRLRGDTFALLFNV